MAVLYAQVCKYTSPLLFLSVCIYVCVCCLSTNAATHVYAAVYCFLMVSMMKKTNQQRAHPLLELV